MTPPERAKITASSQLVRRRFEANHGHHDFLACTGEHSGIQRCSHRNLGCLGKKQDAGHRSGRNYGRQGPHQPPSSLGETKPLGFPSELSTPRRRGSTATRGPTSRGSSRPLACKVQQPRRDLSGALGVLPFALSLALKCKI